MRSLKLVLIWCVLFLAGASSSSAFAPEKRVGNFFDEAAFSRPVELVQVVELHLDNPVWEVEFTLGSTVWTYFDPLGLSRAGTGKKEIARKARERFEENGGWGGVAGNVADYQTNAHDVEAGFHIALTADYSTAMGWVEGAVGTVSGLENAADGAVNTVTLGTWGVAKSSIKNAAKTAAEDALTQSAKDIAADASQRKLREQTNEAHALLDPIAQENKTTALGRYDDGSVGIASSDEYVPGPQQTWAKENGVQVVNGPGHAEETLRDGSDMLRGRLRQVEASRPICLDCEIDVVKARDVRTTTEFSGKRSKGRR